MKTPGSTIRLVASLFALCVASGAPAQPAVPRLEIKSIATFADPAAVPLLAAPTGGAGEQWETFVGGRIVRNVVAPTLTPFLPDPAKATGTAVIVAPGGAFMMLSMDNEGYDVARWLADRGIAAFVLKYRLATTPRDSRAFLAALSSLMSRPRTEGANGRPNAMTTPADALADAQAAVRLVRQRSIEWKVDPARVGFVGFSAGAMATLSVGLSSDVATRPDFIAPIYGPMTARDIPADAPPMFTALAADDPLMGTGDLGLFRSYREAKRPVELHVFESGGHGFGMRKQDKSSDLWIEEFHAWMKGRGLLGR